jgi:hypothetical protein
MHGGLDHFIIPAYQVCLLRPDGHGEPLPPGWFMGIVAVRGPRVGNFRTFARERRARQTRRTQHARRGPKKATSMHLGAWHDRASH